MKRVVLLGVEHFQQGGRGVAAEVHRHLVHLVEQEDGVLAPAFFIIWMIWPGKAPM